MKLVCNCRTKVQDQHGLVHLTWCDLWRPEWIRRQPKPSVDGRIEASKEIVRS